MRKKILILLSTYNGEKYIEEQITSILKQNTLHEFKIRIRDDGSEDNTCNIIKRIQNETHDKIELIEGINLGYNNSFFSLLQGAAGFDYYAISDQDDVWLLDKLQSAIELLENNDKDKPLLYACTSLLVGDNLKPKGQTRKAIKPITLYNTIIQNICPGHNQVMNQALLDILNQQVVDISRIYVYDSWIANIAMLYGKILFDNIPHTYYRQHPTNLLGSGSGFISQLFVSIRHANNGDGKIYRKQIEYFLERNELALQKQGYFEELVSFVQSQKLIQRILYITKSNFYRQRKIETLAFYFAVIIGYF